MATISGNINNTTVFTSLSTADLERDIVAVDAWFTTVSSDLWAENYTVQSASDTYIYVKTNSNDDLKISGYGFSTNSLTMNTIDISGSGNSLIFSGAVNFNSSGNFLGGSMTRMQMTINGIDVDISGSFNFDASGDLSTATFSSYTVSIGIYTATTTGSFVYNASTDTFSGTVASIALSDTQGNAYQISNLNLAYTDDLDLNAVTYLSESSILSGDDTISLGVNGGASYYGYAGDDTITGSAGNDNLYGGSGADSLNGGEGFDYVRYDDSTASGVTAALFAPQLNTGAAYGDTYTSIEGLILTVNADVGYGSNSSDYLYGLNGGDRLYGQAGDDFVYGGEGHDLLWGGLGADFHDGGAGFDYVRYDDAGYAGLTAALFAPQLNTGVAVGDTYANIEGLILGYNDDVGYGSNDDDYIYGINGNDKLYGQGGNDHVYGGAGNDLLWGGLGSDYLSGGAGFDYVRYDDAGFLGFTASLIEPSNNTGVAAGDTYEGMEGLILGYHDDVGHGSDNADYIYGINGNDILYGEGGDDNLFGGSGNDSLTGGAGNDTFWFAGGEGADSITDFEGGSGLGDRLYFGDLFADFDEVVSASTQVGNDVLIDYGSGSVSLLDFTLANLVTDDVALI